ncbi:MAG TPA: lytic transglycosylase domain-containing protein [Pseudobdellovibrionaceae bacterium]|nr:lytic transglycosylase domain-containing protein [Pseudobdellovibrionaceae bacterium]
MNYLKCFLNIFFVFISSLSEASTQKSHARELLGKYFERSPASRSLLVPMKKLITEEFFKQLPVKYKSRAKELSALLIQQSERKNLDPLFVMSLIKTESNFNPEALGTIGEVGLMQLRPETAQWMASKVQMPWKNKEQLKNPSYNIKMGIAYLSYLKTHFDNEAAKYLPAYNAGPKKVKSLFEKNTPPQKYSLKVMKNYKNFYAKWTYI